jgi:hypothetical protein
MIPLFGLTGDLLINAREDPKLEKVLSSTECSLKVNYLQLLICRMMRNTGERDVILYTRSKIGIDIGIIINATHK